ncbi:MAG: hypothetical protein RI564_05330 [Gracilimonas sp.]|nr:hypothetical protein [Gracilimonas sp.]
MKEKKASRSNKENAKQAGHLLDTLLNEPLKGARKKDRISDFYAAINDESIDASKFDPAGLGSSSTPNKTLAINKKRADRHGRT